MKKAKSGKEAILESLLFPLFKRDADDQKVKAHWRKIAEKIEQQTPGSTDWEKNKIYYKQYRSNFT